MRKIEDDGETSPGNGLHIGGSDEFAPIGAVDKTVIRDPYTKEPIIPGSSMKGKIRSLLRRNQGA